MSLRPLLMALLLSMGSTAPGCDDPAESNRGGEDATAEKASPPAPTDQQGKSNEAVWEKTVALMEQLAETAAANEDDCVEMAMEIDAILGKNKKLLERARSTTKANAQDRELQEKFQPRVMAAMAQLMPAMEKCKDNRALNQAMQKLGE